MGNDQATEAWGAPTVLHGRHVTLEPLQPEWPAVKRNLPARLTDHG